MNLTKVFIPVVFIIPVIVTVQANTVKQYDDQIKKLESSEKKISLINNDIRLLDSKITQQKNKKIKLSHESAVISTNYAFHVKLIGQQLRQLQKIKNQPLIKRLIKPDNYSKSVRHSEYLLSLRRSHLSTIFVLNSLDDELKDNRKNSKLLVNKLSKSKLKLVKQREKLNLKRRERKGHIKDLKNTIKNEEIAKYANLKRINAYRKTFIKQKKTINKNDLSFVKLKGKMNWPSSGQFTSLKDYNHKAWQVSHQNPMPVKVIADGEVVATLRLPLLGLVVVIDHGGNYSSVYGNNGQVIVKINQKVSSGDTISFSGNSGGREDVGLFFQLRLNKKPVDFRQWLIVNKDV